MGQASSSGSQSGAASSASSLASDERWLKLSAGDFFDGLDLDVSTQPQQQQQQQPQQKSSRLPPFDRSSPRGGSSSMSAAWWQSELASKVNQEDLSTDLDLQALAAVLTMRSNAEEYLLSDSLADPTDCVQQLENIALLLPHEDITMALRITMSDKLLLATESQRSIRSRAVLRLHLAINRHMAATSAAIRSSRAASTNNSGDDAAISTVAKSFSMSAKSTRGSPPSDTTPTLSDLLFSTSISVSASTLRGLIESDSGTIVVSHAFLSLLSVLETLLPHVTALPRSIHFAQEIVEAAKDDIEVEGSHKALLAWDKTRSNANLEFNEDATTARRPGNASSYPSAVVYINQEESYSLTVVLSEATHNNNWLTFGIAFASFPHASSDGFGRQSNSWGLQDDRSSSSDSALLSCGVKEASFRKLKLGDVISLICDLKVGYCDIVINAGEFRHRFTIPTGRSGEGFVLGATFANDHKLRIIPLPYRMIEVLSRAQSYAPPINPSARIVRCPNNHAMTATHGLPPSEETANGIVIITCNSCSRSHIHQDKVCYHTCEICPISYDLCFACSIATCNYSRRCKVPAITNSNGASSGSTRNPLANLGEDGPAAVALEQLLNLGRLEVERGAGETQFSSSVARLPSAPTPSSSSQNPFVAQRLLSMAAYSLSESESRGNVALSIMFAIALLRHSLSGVLEVLYLLQESPHDRHILPCAEKFVAYLLGAGNSTDVSTDVFFSRTTEKDSHEHISSSLKFSDLAAAGVNNSYFSLQELSRGEKQAIAIVNALGEVASGSSSTIFSITQNFELDLLVRMIEQGSCVLAYDEKQVSGSRLKEAFIEVSFCAAAMRILYNNLCRMFGKGTGVDAVVSASPLDECHSSRSAVTYRQRIRKALAKITENPRIDPINSCVGKFAVNFAAFNQLTPKASAQFSLVRELLEKMEMGTATMCEQELLLLQMSNLHGPKLLELVSSSTAGADENASEDEDVSAGANFLTSLLMLADRSLRTKCSWLHKRINLLYGESKDEETLYEEKVDTSPWDDGSSTFRASTRQSELQEVLQEVILKVLEPIAMQVVSMLMDKVISQADQGDKSHNIRKLNSLVLTFVHSAQAAVSILSSLPSDRDGEITYFTLSDEISKSHVASLLPLSLFTLNLFLSEALVDPKTANIAFEFAELMAPLTSLADSIRKVELCHASSHHAKRSANDIEIPSAACFEKALSDSTLVFNTSATICSYPESHISNEQIFENEHADDARSPAAFISLPADYSSCSILIEAMGNATYNQFSVGVCKSGTAPTFEGFGLTADSFGLVNPRDDSETAYFAFSGIRLQDAPRKLTAEDSVTILCDLTRGVLRFIVKNIGIAEDFQFTFDKQQTTSESAQSASGPQGTAQDFWYGATFATDHQLQVQHNIKFMMKNQEVGGSASAVLESDEGKVPASSWLSRLKTEVQSLQDVIIKQHLEVEEKKVPDAHISAANLKSCYDWLDTPLFSHGKLPLEDASMLKADQDDQTSPALKLLWELTDAPDGMGNAQRLVATMKKFVLQDRGRVAGPSHIAHAACAAAIWHKGYAQEVYQILQSSIQGVEIKPSEGLKKLWRQGQSMRKIFESESDFPSEPPSPLLSPLTPPPPPSPNDEGFDDMPESADQLPEGPLLQKQFSLPPLQDGQEPLEPALLSAVRRARLLLSFQPASTLCSSDAPILLMEKVKTDDKSSLKSLFNFIVSGPDPDDLRSIVAMRSETAARRCKGLDLSLDLCIRSKVVQDIREGIVLLRRVAMSLHHLAHQPGPTASTPVSVAEKSKLSASEVVTAKEDAADAATVPPRHYLVNLQGSALNLQVAVRSAWFSLLAHVVDAGNCWMDELEGTLLAHERSSKVSGVLAVFATVSIDFDYFWDLEHLATSGLIHFTLRCLRSTESSIREASLVLFESLSCVASKGIEFFSKLEASNDNTSRPEVATATVLLNQLLVEGSDYLRATCRKSLVNSHSLSELQQSSTIEVEVGEDKVFGYRLLDGCTLCDRSEEGSMLFLSSQAEEPADTVKTNAKYGKGYSLTAWLYRKKDAPAGVILRRGLPTLQNSDLSRASAQKSTVVFAWSYLAVSILPSGQLSVLISDPVATDKDNVFEISSAGSLQSEAWAYFGFSVDFIASTISLYLDNVVIATKPLSLTLVEGAKAQNAVNATALPFRSMLFSGHVSQVSAEPFAIGQQLNSYPLLSASCLLANVSVFAMPISRRAFDAILIRTVPAVAESRESLTYDVTSMGVRCHNASSVVQSVYSCMPATVFEAQWRIDTSDAVNSIGTGSVGFIVKKSGSGEDVVVLSFPLIQTSQLSLYLDQRRGLMTSHVAGANSIDEQTFEVTESAGDGIYLRLSLAPGQAVTLLNESSGEVPSVEGWSKFQTSPSDNNSSGFEPAEVQILTMWDLGISACNQVPDLSIKSSSHVIKVLAAFMRIGKALVVLSRRHTSFFDEVFGDRCKLLEHFFCLAFSAASSTVRLAATRSICVFLSLFKPAYIDSMLLKLGYLASTPTEDERIEHEASKFIAATVRTVGCLANPYGMLDTLKTDGSYYLNIFQLKSRSMLVFQLKEILASVASVNVGNKWKSHLQATTSEIVQRSRSALTCLTQTANKHSDSSHEPVTVDWLMGFLNIGCSSDVLPGQTLYPGCRVLHKGVGSSVAEDHTILAFGTKGSFGEQMYIAPTKIYNQVRRSEITEFGSIKEGPQSHQFECVFTSILQQGAKPKNEAPLINIFAVPSGNDDTVAKPSENFDAKKDLFVLLQDSVSIDTSDPRALPPYPRREDGSRGLATVLERRELMFESLHNYRDNTDELREVCIPGASELVVTFDPASRTELNYDFVRLYKDSKKSGFWGAEKYSGTTWPGVNGTDPLVIPTDSFFLYFHSDGNNVDWGFRFTVVGHVPTRVPRILRAPSRTLLVGRLVRIMAIDIVVSLLTNVSPKAQDHEEHADVRGQQLADFEGSIAEYFGPKLWRDVLHSHCSNCISRSLADADEGDSPLTRLEVKLSNVPPQPEKHLATLLTMLINNRSLTDGSRVARDDSFFGVATAGNNKLFASIVDGLSYKSVEHSEDLPSDAIEPLSEDLISHLAMEGLAPMHVPSDTVATLNSNDQLVDFLEEGSGEAEMSNMPQIKLQTLPGTTHCRIRLGPSMDTAEVGDFADGSVATVVSEVGGFYRLAEDRGFVKNIVDRAFDWHRITPTHSSVISFADQNSRRVKTVKAKIEIDLTDYWECALLQALDGVVARSIYSLLCTTLTRWPKGVPFVPDEGGQVHLLIKATGMGSVAIPKDVLTKKKQQVTLFSKKRQSSTPGGKLSTTPLLTSFYKFLSAQTETSLDGTDDGTSPFMLSMLSVSAGILQQARTKCLLEHEVVVPVAPDPQTLLTPVVIESEHEYLNNTDSFQRIHLPDAKGLEIIFDDESSTERNYDYVVVYADETKQQQLGGKYSGKRSSSERNFPGVGENPSLQIEGRNEVWIHFVTDGTNVDWGWRLTAYPLIFQEVGRSTERNPADIIFSVRPGKAVTAAADAATTNQTSSATLNLPLQLDGLSFDPKDAAPSFAMAVTMLDAVFGTKRSAKSNKKLVSYLFSSENGSTLLDALIHSVDSINHEHPVVGTCFLDIIIFVVGAYKLHGEMNCLAHTRALMARLASRVIRFAEPAIVSSNPGKSVRSPSPFMQSLSQAAVICYHACLDVSIAPTDQLENVGMGASSSEMTSTFSENHLYLGPHLITTHGGRGVRLATASENSSATSIACGPIFPDISFPCTLDQAADTSDKSNYEHTCYVKIISEGVTTARPFAAKMSIGVSILTNSASLLSGDHGSTHGSIAWESSIDKEGRCTGCVKHATLETATPGLKEFPKFADLSRGGFRAGDIIGITLSVRQAAPAIPSAPSSLARPSANVTDSAADSSASTNEPDTPAVVKKVAAEWSIEFTRNGTTMGGITSNRPIPFLDDSILNDDLLDSTFAVSVGLSSPNAEVLFLDAIDVPSITRRASTSISSPFVDLSSAIISKQIINSRFQGKVISAWMPNISDPDLIFTNGDALARRPGSSSCYPASLVTIDEPSVSFTCTLMECPIGPNSMSIGIAKAGFKKTGSDGLGPSVNSWGIIESRSSGDGKVYANRTVVTTFRKMKQGDTFCIRYERSLGKAWLLIDGAGRDFSAPELMQEFDIHRPDEIVPLVIGATFCNDHSLQVQDSPPPFVPHVDSRPSDLKSSLSALSSVTAKATSQGLVVSNKSKLGHDYMRARAVTSGNVPLAIQSADAVRDRYLRLDTTLGAMYPPTSVEQFRAVHMPNIPTTLSSHLKSLWTVYGLLLVLSRTETNADRDRDAEGDVKLDHSLIPASLIYSLLMPLCMASSQVVLRASNTSALLPESSSVFRHNVRIPGAIAYAVQVLPTSTLGPQGSFTMSCKSPVLQSGVFYSSFRGCASAATQTKQSDNVSEDEPRADFSIVSELLDEFSKVKSALLLVGPSQLVAGYGKPPLQYLFAPGDVVTRQTTAPSDENSMQQQLGELGDVVGVFFRVTAADGTVNECEMIADGVIDHKNQVLKVCWRNDPSVVESIFMGENPSDQNANWGPGSSSPPEMPKPLLWKQGFRSGSATRDAGTFSRGSRVLWSPVQSESVDICIEWDNSSTPGTPKEQELTIVLTPLFPLDYVLRDATFSEARRRVAMYPYDPSNVPSSSSGPSAESRLIDSLCRRNSEIDLRLKGMIEKKCKDKDSKNWAGALCDKWTALAPATTEALVHSPALLEVLALEHSLSPCKLLASLRSGGATASENTPIDNILTNPDMTGVNLDSSSVQQSASESATHSLLDPRQSLVLAARMAMIQTLNVELIRCIDLIDFSTISPHGLSGSAHTIGTLLRNTRSLIFSFVKSPIVEGAIAKSELQNATRFELIISRPRAARFANRGECDIDGRWSVFGQVFRRMQGMAPSTLRKTTALWDTVFAGERAQDAGGPYRESWSAFTQELVSPTILPLLRLCPNGRHSVGTHRDTFVLNPDASSGTHMVVLNSFPASL